MKRHIPEVLLVVAVLVFLMGNAFAKDINPNGYPSGPHYNLNIIGKKAGFTCPGPEIDPMTGDPVYGNVIFIPEDGEGIEIFMESGKGKKAEAITSLQVVDPCAGFDGDGAIVQLPKNEAGYRVYARALGKPTNSPTIVTSPALIAVEDEIGSDLIYLGLVSEGGFTTPSASFTRNKGKSKATDITGLFEWSGTVCYLSAPDGAYAYTEERCCIDYDGDGTYDECTEAATDQITGEPSCPVGYTAVTLYCTQYTNEWVFNIGAFVTYLWHTDNKGVNLLQVRFYPN
ncbi:MAG: hypothetical protein ACMUIS_11990 [bacterium]